MSAETPQGVTFEQLQENLARERDLLDADRAVIERALGNYEEWYKLNPFDSLEYHECNRQQGYATGEAHLFAFEEDAPVHGANLLLPMGKLAQKLAGEETICAMQRFHIRKKIWYNLQLTVRRGQQPQTTEEVLVRARFETSGEPLHMVGTATQRRIHQLMAINPVPFAFQPVLVSTPEQILHASDHHHFRMTALPHKPHIIKDKKHFGLQLSTYIELINLCLLNLTSGKILPYESRGLLAGVRSLRLPDPSWLARGDGDVKLQVHPELAVQSVSHPGNLVIPITFTFYDNQLREVGGGELAFSTSPPTTNQ